MGVKRREPYYATGQPVPPGDDGWDRDTEELTVPDPQPIAPKKPAATKAVKIPKVTTIDFETMGIEGRPDYPPEPVGVAIKPWGKKAKYYAWGHLRGANNCTKEEASAALRAAYANPDGILFHHAKFDLDVAEVHFGLELPPWRHAHDTTFMLFLHDPHIRFVGLKEAAESILGQPPEERDAVADWLVENQPVEGVKISRSPKGKEPYGKYIAWAPPAVAGPYAIGDVDRTVRLFEHLYPSLAQREMLPAYDRERRLTPILLGMERSGIRVDLPRLRADVARYGDIVTRLDTYIKQRLGVDGDPEFNVDSGQQVVAALVAAGLADVAAMGITKTGKVKSDKNALDVGVADKVLSAVMKYATQLKTCLNTFMKPWLAMAIRSGGFIFTTWNQIRGADAGARTGRFSSTPNFQNIPKEFEPIFKEEALAASQTAEERAAANRLPSCPWKDLPSLPLCRGYIVPYSKGHVLVGRDYSQQEPRILAHFEDGALLAQYQADPWIDYHDNAKFHLERIFNRPFKRKPVKNINLGIIYGQGVPSLAFKNGETVEATQDLKNAILALYPGLKDMGKDMKLRARSNQPIRTWGGREYYCEPPRIIDGRIQTFDYKMINVLVQGSAADCTKEGMIRFMEYVHRQHNRGWRMILQVHDEIVVSVPAGDLVECQEALREAMESVEFDVKILSEGSWSPDNWSVMKDFDKKGKRVAGKLPPQKRQVVKERVSA
jgi:DNA polymerase I-like protein with 3'-5' exonuclease and polymerase domains